ncbi:MAG: radical SAM protein, partial [Armatimonadota bacterium]|nr:radical SAM protein [Armatimonadota bacterium]
MIPSKLIKNARNLLARESGTIYKQRHGKLTFALAFPNIYRLGMSSLGFQLVYSMLNAIPDVVCERVFLPESDEIETLKRSGSRLFSLESQTPVSEYDALGFSISFEMDYLNILQMLSLSGIPLLAAER